MKDSHLGKYTDDMVRLANHKSGYPLCRRCDGTGNEFYSMFRECQTCEGSGVARGCQCDACYNGIKHSSDCAVHNEPAYPNEDCTCGVVTPTCGGPDDA